VRARRGLGAGVGLALLVALAACGGSSGSRSSGVFSYDVKRPLAFRDVRVVNHGYPIKVHDVSFASAKGGRVHAYLVVPPGKGPFPAVIWAHGSGVTRSDLLVQATWFAARGSVELVPDDPFERNRDLYTAPPPELRRAVIQEIVDLRRMVDLIGTLGYVDAKRIAYTGLSLGARYGAFLAGAEPRIKAFDLQSGRAGSFAADLDELTWIRRAHADFLFQLGRHDELIPRAALLSLARAAPKPKTIRWYDAGHGLNTAALRDQLRWLASELGLGGPVVPGALAGP
jgi:dienelactone hydrolase